MLIVMPSVAEVGEGVHVGVGGRVPHDHLRVDLERSDHRQQRRVGPRQDLAVGGAERQRDVVVAVHHGLEVGSRWPGRPSGPRRPPRWAGRASRAGRTPPCSRRRPRSRARSGCRWRRTPTRGTSRSGSRSLAGHTSDRSTAAPPAALPVGAAADAVPAASVPGAAEAGASVIGASVPTASVPIGSVPAGVVGGGLDAAPSAGTTRPPPTASSTIALVVDFFTVSPCVVVVDLGFVSACAADSAVHADTNDSSAHVVVPGVTHPTASAVTSRRAWRRSAGSFPPCRSRPSSTIAGGGSSWCR